MMFNLKNVDMTGEWARIILFNGEGARFVQTGVHEILYSGGFMGTQYNPKIAAFEIEHHRFVYNKLMACKKVPIGTASPEKHLGRMGHLAVWDNQAGYLILFGGQKSSDQFESNTNQRLLLNDLIIFDVERMELVDQMVFSDATVGRRVYHCGFKIDDSIFSIGGQGPNGKIYDEFIEIDVPSRKNDMALCDYS